MVLDNVKFLAQRSFSKTHEAVGIECETDHLCLDHCVCVCVREREREREPLRASYAIAAAKALLLHMPPTNCSEIKEK